MTATIPNKTPKRNGRMNRHRGRTKTQERNRRILNERKRSVLRRIENRPGPERDHMATFEEPELRLPRAIALVDYRVRRNEVARKSHAKTW